jgi:hypothetical protein
VIKEQLGRNADSFIGQSSSHTRVNNTPAKGRLYVHSLKSSVCSPPPDQRAGARGPAQEVCATTAAVAPSMATTTATRKGRKGTVPAASSGL